METEEQEALADIDTHLAFLVAELNIPECPRCGERLPQHWQCHESACVASRTRRGDVKYRCPTCRKTFLAADVEVDDHTRPWGVNQLHQGVKTLVCHVKQLTKRLAALEAKPKARRNKK